MKTQILTMDELVFSNRNRLYGAYYLRTHYEKILLKSLSIVFGILLLLYGVKVMCNNHKDMVRDIPKIDVGITMVDPVYPDEHPIIEPQIPMGRSICFTTPVITTNITEDLPIQDDFHNIDPGHITNFNGPDIVDTTTQRIVDIHVEPTIEIVVDEPAEYPGGLLQLKKDIFSNLVYPKEALDNDITGKVVIRFVVDDQGNVGGFEIKKSTVDESCEKEALRVTSFIKKWKPARKNGDNCYSYYYLPIEFQIKH